VNDRTLSSNPQSGGSRLNIQAIPRLTSPGGNAFTAQIPEVRQPKAGGEGSCSSAHRPFLWSDPRRQRPAREDGSPSGLIRVRSGAPWIEVPDAILVVESYWVAHRRRIPIRRIHADAEPKAWAVTPASVIAAAKVAITAKLPAPTVCIPPVEVAGEATVVSALRK
jgi:hypothetical protein